MTSNREVKQMGAVERKAHFNFSYIKKRQSKLAEVFFSAQPEPHSPPTAAAAAAGDNIELKIGN